jgi:predicted dehydrogenase
MEKIKWGIIGCGDVTEVKSGPAFSKVPHSELVAVMRRNSDKVVDYAKRHRVAKWYTDANDLINDPEVNAIYVATPPLQHEEYTLAALQAGKPVYVEKPMSIDFPSAQRMASASKGHKVCVAHYRRAQPLFMKVKELLESRIIGDLKYVDLKFLQAPLSPEELQKPGFQWRVDPSVAGGGLFHDLAPHQLDLMIFFFGRINRAFGTSLNQDGLYAADDIVCGDIVFNSGIIFHGLWCFGVPPAETRDICEIVGSEGKITFSIFGEPEIRLSVNGKDSSIVFDKLQHVQQPMIEKVVDYFLHDTGNPSPVEDGLEVMRVIDVFTHKQPHFKAGQYQEGGIQGT